MKAEYRDISDNLLFINDNTGVNQGDHILFDGNILEVRRKTWDFSSGTIIYTLSNTEYNHFNEPII